MLITALLIIAVSILIFTAVYDTVHHCHGNGKYYWTIECVSSGKVVSCQPVRLEETVCDK